MCIPLCGDEPNELNDRIGSEFSPNPPKAPVELPSVEELLFGVSIFLESPKLVLTKGCAVDPKLNPPPPTGFGTAADVEVGDAPKLKFPVAGFDVEAPKLNLLGVLKSVELVVGLPKMDPVVPADVDTEDAAIVES